MRKTSLRRAALLTVGLTAGALGLTGCANYSGNGNEFEVSGEVLHSGERSLTVNITDIDYENGDASGWFDDYKDHQIHDNCNCAGDVWSSNKEVGIVYDYNGSVIEPSDVVSGACVHFVGKIRSHHEGKSDLHRPVFDVAQLIPC